MFHGENCCNEESFVSQLRDDDNGEGGKESVNKVVVRDGGAGFRETLSRGESLQVSRFQHIHFMNLVYGAEIVQIFNKYGFLGDCMGGAFMVTAWVMSVCVSGFN